MKRKFRNILALLLVCSLCIGNMEPMKAKAGGSDGETMDTDELVFITLAENTTYRWNANGEALQNNVIHLDKTKGKNCKFMLKKVVNDDGKVDSGDVRYYGIKHIKDGGTDLLADIEGKSNDDNKKLHLWESDDKKIRKNEHRQFAFYYAGKTLHGDKCYYIKVRKSGKWLGVEDSNENNKIDKGDKIIQTSKDNRKDWIITDAVVPKGGWEAEDIIDEKDKSAFIEIFKKGTISAVNRAGDLAQKGTNLHLYDVGTSSKWRIDWNSKYSAYTIHAVTSGEKDRGSLFTDGAVVWDVENQYGDKVHLWSELSKDKNENTSQLWRFIKLNNGSYKIQSARNGRYVEEKSGLLLDPLTLSDDGGTEFEISVIAGEDEINYNYAVDWMKDIPDDVYLSSVNIPGTHDTGTASVWEDFIAQLSWTSCQKLYYGEQLNVGARSFDIRCDAQTDTASPNLVNIIHGFSAAKCADRSGEVVLTLKDIFDDSVQFLKEHDTETVILMLKPDAGSTTGLAHAVTQFIKKNKEYVYTGNGIPSMGEARGKIVFMRRFAIDTSLYNPADDGVDPSWLGIDLSNWDNNKYSDYKYAINIYDKDGVSVYAQDAYNVEAYTKKREFVEGTLRQTVGESDSAPKIPSDAWVYNYVSTAGIGGIETPLSQTRGINPWLFNDEMKCIDNRRLGMVMMNFIDAPMAKLIYETSLKRNDFFVKKPETSKASYAITKSKDEGAEACYSKPYDKNVTSVKIPDTVEIDGVTYKVTSIAEEAFAESKKLKKVVIGNNVVSIGKRAFYNCTNLQSVKLGKNVTVIEEEAFCGCKKLKDVVIKSAKLKKSSLGKKSFSGLHKKLTIKVPQSKLEKYKKILEAKNIKFNKIKKS